MKNYAIRKAEPKDLDEIVELSALHAAYEKADYDPSGKKEALNSHLFGENRSLYCLVVQDSSSAGLVGYTTYMKQFSTWDANFYIYMDCLYLTADSRGFGIGEAVMNRIKAEGRALGCALIQWQTPNFNTRAIKFYNRIGGSSKEKERFFLFI